MGLEESYDQLMGESEILPTAKWPLIHNPVLIVLITIGYLYFILYAGPCYMKDRPPFKLKTFMLFYDVIQILANAWIIKEFIAADERATLIPLVNCSIHVIMYIYYFIAGWSQELQQVVSPFKPYITRLQMVQFIGLILYVLQSALPHCIVSEKITHIIPIFSANLLVYLCLFYNFYRNTYNKKKP
ncbi:elongation of very long chain fatty acids protein 1-like isoform X2 [Pseudomyrmex gracilis]|uniref:elongation of very long chain fatty acids protein 1-like isoform X2 n=1 Tax=Pseudomyrmex gracilis TaxID=219809 RepID=UPI0009956C0F|nr:elongation of very long chain fatty acids protein 1-like isoform X2 [Pseudomyrmex gracilis]